MAVVLQRNRTFRKNTFDYNPGQSVMGNGVTQADSFPLLTLPDPLIYIYGNEGVSWKWNEWKKKRQKKHNNNNNNDSLSLCN